MYTLIIDHFDEGELTLTGLDPVAVLAATNSRRMDLPAAEFARLLDGGEVRRLGYRLKVRNEANDVSAIDRIAETLVANEWNADTADRIAQLIEWVRPGFRDTADDEVESVTT